MGNVNFNKELARVVVAGVVAFLVGLILKKLGGGKWTVAAVSGAVGGVAATAVIA